MLDARDADVHEGRHRLLFDTDLQHFDTSQAGPPPGGYPASMVFGPEGPAWLVDDGKPSRRLVPIRQGGSWTTHVAIANAPAEHRGKPLANRDPVSICAIVVDYLGELVHEAETHFPEQ